MAAVMARIGRLKDLEMAWRLGSRRERELVLVVLLAPAVLLGILVISNIFILANELGGGSVLQVNLAIILAGSSWYFFQPAIAGPMYSDTYYREAIRLGWLSPLQCEYAKEVIRYRETSSAVGEDVRHYRWAKLHAAAYYVGIFGAATFSLGVGPLLGSWTVLAFAVCYIPVTVTLWRTFWRRMRIEGDTAAERGFRMREIGVQMLGELRKERQRERRPP